MKQNFLASFACSLAILATAPMLARADVKPNFEDDAIPILSQQPGLIEYVEARFQVKDTGIAKAPGGDDHPPVPPYIFRARARGSNGPYNLRLLIQPGPPGHILGIVKDSPSTPPPAIAKAPAPQPAAPANPPTTISKPPAASPPPPAPTADTPSGPITNSPSLAPPPDPVPTAH